MAQPCKPCLHPESRQLDADLLAGIRSVGELAISFRLSDSSIRRHRANHLSASVLTSPRAGEDHGPADLLQNLVSILNDAEAVRRAALVGNKPDQVLRAGRESRAVIELLLDRLGITDLEVIEELTQQTALAKATGQLIRRAPQWGLALAAQLEENGEGAVAFQLRDFAETSKLAIDRKAS